MWISIKYNSTMKFTILKFVLKAKFNKVNIFKNAQKIAIYFDLKL